MHEHSCFLYILSMYLYLISEGHISHVLASIEAKTNISFSRSRDRRHLRSFLHRSRLKIEQTFMKRMRICSTGIRFPNRHNSKLFVGS